MSKDIENGIKLALVQNEKQYDIVLEHCSLKKYTDVDSYIVNLFKKLNTNKKFKNRDAISEALIYSVKKLQEVNISDIYHHLVYRTYCREYNASNPKQSWARAGGEAMEIFIKKSYASYLKEHGIYIYLAFEESENKFLIDMELNTLVAGKSKLDIGLYGDINGALVPFGGIHSKASLAERVSDDKPCSEIMMKNGFFSYLLTFDAKSFPPPVGNLINKGELGSVQNPSDKRNYIEEHGYFSACFSYNKRTIPSLDRTNSGKKIFVVNKIEKNDDFLQKVVSDWNTFKKKRHNSLA